jgi:hypothetical protein
MLTDNLGTVRYVVDQSGTVVDKIDYNSFGQVISGSGRRRTFRRSCGRNRGGTSEDCRTSGPKDRGCKHVSFRSNWDGGVSCNNTGH